MALRNLLFPALLLLLVSCGGARNSKSHGPIVLGDSSTIVNVSDPALLRDEVPDLKPVLKEEDSSSTKPDTAALPQPAPTAAAAPESLSGLVVPFKEITINIPDINTRSYGKPNLQKAHGASYELTDGSLEGKQIRLSGSPVTAVSQRSQTMLLLQDGNDKLMLESLPRQSSDWEQLKGSGGVYPISGLSENELDYKLPSERALRNAVQHAARRAHLNRRDTQDWLESVRRLRAPHQAPAVVVLRAVMWRIEGKGFQKDLRIDVPLH